MRASKKTRPDSQNRPGLYLNHRAKMKLSLDHELADTCYSASATGRTPNRSARAGVMSPNRA